MSLEPPAHASQWCAAVEICVYSPLSQKTLFAFPNTLLSSREFWRIWKFQEVNWGCQESSTRLIISVDSRRKKQAGWLSKADKQMARAQVKWTECRLPNSPASKVIKHHDAAADFIIDLMSVCHDEEEGDNKSNASLPFKCEILFDDMYQNWLREENGKDIQVFTKVLKDNSIYVFPEDYKDKK